MFIRELDLFKMGIGPSSSLVSNAMILALLKAYRHSTSLRKSGKHMISIDQCIAAMKKTVLDMSRKYKETSLGGLAVSFIECQTKNILKQNFTTINTKT